MTNIIFYYSDKEKTKKMYFVQYIDKRIVVSHNIEDAAYFLNDSINLILNLLNDFDKDNEYLKFKL
jgi:hypothetical protein